MDLALDRVKLDEFDPGFADVRHFTIFPAQSPLRLQRLQSVPAGMPGLARDAQSEAHSRGARHGHASRSNCGGIAGVDRKLRAVRRLRPAAPQLC